VDLTVIDIDGTRDAEAVADGRCQAVPAGQSLSLGRQ
jgi:hypothetical protein